MSAGERKEERLRILGFVAGLRVSHTIFVVLVLFDARIIEERMKEVMSHCRRCAGPSGCGPRRKCKSFMDEKIRKREDSFVRCCRERIPHMPNILM